MEYTHKGNKNSHTRKWNEATDEEHNIVIHNANHGLDERNEGEQQWYDFFVDRKLI